MQKVRTHTEKVSLDRQLMSFDGARALSHVRGRLQKPENRSLRLLMVGMGHLARRRKIQAGTMCSLAS